MALPLAMAITIWFIRPNEADIYRVQGGGRMIGTLHAKVWQLRTRPTLLLVIIGAVHEVLTSKPPHSMGLLMIIAVPRKINTEIDHLGLIVGLSTTVYMSHRLDADTYY